MSFRSIYTEVIINETYGCVFVALLRCVAAGCWTVSSENAAYLGYCFRLERFTFIVLLLLLLLLYPSFLYFWYILGLIYHYLLHICFVNK